VKIDIRRISPEGVALAEEIPAKALDLETDIIKFRGPVKVKAEISRITNAVSVNLALSAVAYSDCSRCLKEFDKDFSKKVELNYSVSNSDLTLDLDPDIREEIILDYEVNPLCNPGCKGLCPKCGKNLNEGGCTCGST